MAEKFNFGFEKAKDQKQNKMSELKKETKFRELDLCDKEDICDWLRYECNPCVELLHKIHPKLVFLTLTSSIPYGIMLKEVYKKRYPNEDAPKFLTIDPKPIRHYYEPRTVLKKDDLWQELVDKTVEKLKKYNVKDEDIILLMDETQPDWGGIVRSKGYKDKYAKKRLSLEKSSIGISNKILQNALEKTNCHAQIKFEYIASDRLREKNNTREGVTGWVEDKDESGVIYARRYTGDNERSISKENFEYLKRVSRMTKEEKDKEYSRIKFLRHLRYSGFRSDQTFIGLSDVLLKSNKSVKLELPGKNINISVLLKSNKSVKLELPDKNINISKLILVIKQNRQKIQEITDDDNLTPKSKKTKINKIIKQQANFLENGNYFLDS